jgi:SAM-dependent methyltransferase
MDSPQVGLADAAGALTTAFRRTLPLRLRLNEVRRALGSTVGLACLDLGATNPVFSRHLRAAGGDWQTVVMSAALVPLARAVLGDEVCLLRDGRLPFEDKSFDRVVLAELLERSDDEAALIQECHRVLKSDGRLIASARHAKRWSLIAPLRALLRLPRRRAGPAHDGYTERVLFDMFKTGFDVIAMRTHQRFLLELVDSCVQACRRMLMTDGTGLMPGERRLDLVAFLPYHLAYQLDVAFFMTRGFCWTVEAKRRPWRPRQAPILADGRSIQEAVLTRIPM